jgi:hypothetical protein
MENKTIITLDNTKKLSLQLTLEQWIEHYEFFKQYENGTVKVFRYLIAEMIKEELFNQIINKE